MGWDWEASHHVFYGAQVVTVDAGDAGSGTIWEAAQYQDDGQGWLDYVMPSDQHIDNVQRRVLGLPEPVFPEAPRFKFEEERRKWPYVPRSKRSRFEKAKYEPATNYPLLFRNFASGSFDYDGRGDMRPDNQVNDHPRLDAYLVVKSTLVEHRFDKSIPRGNVRWGAHVEPLATVSDAERDALERVVEELSEEGEYTFGEPGWFDVARETSG